MLTMAPRTPAGETDDLAGLGRPLWDDVLQRDPRRVVHLDAATRRIMRIVRLDDAQDAIARDRRGTLVLSGQHEYPLRRR